MAAKDFELVLKVQADLQQAVKQLRDLNDNMRVTKTTAQQASVGLEAIGRSAATGASGIRGITRQLDDMGGSIKSAAGHLKVLAGVIGVAFVVHKVADFTKSLIDANEQLFQMTKQAQGLNVSVKFLSGINEQADDLGVSVEQVAKVFSTLNRQIATAQDGSASAQALFKSFGVDPSKVHSTEQAFLAIADSVAKYGLNAKRAGELTQILGTSGKDIVPILQQGAAAIRDQNDAMEKTGQIVTDKDVPAITQLHNATDQIGDSFTALRNNLIIQLAPSISKIADQFNDFVTTHGPELIDEVRQIVDKLPDLATGFISVADAAIRVAAKVAAFVGQLKGLAEYAAKMQNGAAPDDLDALRVERDDVQAVLAQRENHPFLSGFASGGMKAIIGSSPLPGLSTFLGNVSSQGQARLLGMSTDALRARLDKIDSDLLHARFSPKPAKNPQEGDNRGLTFDESFLIHPTSGNGSTADPAAAQKAAALAKQAAAAQDALTQSLISMQGQLSPTAAAWAQYNAAVKKANDEAELAKKAKGADAQAIDAQRDAVIKLAGTIRDAALDKIAEQDRQAWEALKRSFETPAQVSVDDALKKIAQLNDLLKKGTIDSAQYHQALDQIGAGSVTAAPQYQGLDAAVGGVGSELSKNFAAQQQLDAWHQQVLAANEAFRNQDAGNEEAYQARLAEIDRQYAAQRNKIEQARGELALQTSANIFGQLATLSSSHNSKMAAIGKAAAIAQAIINTYQSATEAYKSLAGIPVIGPALAVGAAAAAVAAGLANVAQIRAQSVGGYAEGGYTGAGGKHQVAGVVHAGEVVWSQADIARAGGVSIVEMMRLRGYADGGFVHPLANAPTPAQLGFAAPRQPRMDFGKLAAANDGAARGPGVGVRIVNSIDPEFATSAMNSAAGEKVIMNVLSRNSVKLKQMVR